MQINASQTSYYSAMVREETTKTEAVKAKKTEKSGSAKKPEWNPYKVYKYLEDMNDGFQSYKKEAVSYYQTRISEEEEGVLSVEELKEQIKEWFPEYTLTDRKPKDVVQGKFYLYIDQRQLEKLASDPAYRAKVYGLMDSELQGKKGYTLEYSDGRNVTAHLTGSIFSLAEENRRYAGADGIPYLGSCTSDHAFSSSASHVQVRSMSFIYDNIDPAKSAARDRKANAAKIEAEKRAEKKKKKRLEEKKQEKELQEERIKERREKNKEIYDALLHLNTGSRYRSANDIETVAEKDGERHFGNMREMMQYLSENYESVRRGVTQISRTYLRKCLEDEKEFENLTQKLKDADGMLKDAEENLEGFQGMTITIDEDGDMESETRGGKVSFNEGKRARQLAAAKTPENVNVVMGLLAKDLEDCEAGVQNGMCDENEVAKVKAMIQKAQQKMAEVMAGGNSGEDENQGFDEFSISMLM